MTLAGWQSGLGEFIHLRASGRGRNAHAASIADRPDLTHVERRWLLALSENPGFALTCQISQWWRELKIRWAARLTCAQLSGESRDYLRDYIDCNRFSSFFFVAEAVGFLDYLLAQAHVPDTARTVARFERALLLASEARDVVGGLEQPALCLRQGVALVRCPEATLVSFDRPPEVLLHVLLGGQPASPAQRRGTHPVLVSPRLLHLWRPASQGEARLYRRTRSPVSLTEALHQRGATHQEIRSLIADGIVRLIGDCTQGANNGTVDANQCGVVSYGRAADRDLNV